MSEGHDEPCYYCGKPCNSLAGDPGEWPVGLCHSDDPGVLKFHHERCVNERLERVAEMTRALEAIAGDCEELAASWTPDHPEITKAEARTWASVGKRARAALASGGSKEGEGK